MDNNEFKELKKIIEQCVQNEEDYRNQFPIILASIEEKSRERKKQHLGNIFSTLKSIIKSNNKQPIQKFLSLFVLS